MHVAKLESPITVSTSRQLQVLWMKGVLKHMVQSKTFHAWTYPHALCQVMSHECPTLSDRALNGIKGNSPTIPWPVLFRRLHCHLHCPQHLAHLGALGQKMSKYLHLTRARGCSQATTISFHIGNDYLSPWYTSTKSHF